MKRIQVFAVLYLGAVAVFGSPAIAAPGAVPESGRQAGTSPVKVFILAGQSNMEGAAVVDLDGKDYNNGHGTLVTLMSDPAKAPMFKHLRGADGKRLAKRDHATTLRDLRAAGATPAALLARAAIDLQAPFKPA